MKLRHTGVPKTSRRGPTITWSRPRIQPIVRSNKSRLRIGEFDRACPIKMGQKDASLLMFCFLGSFEPFPIDRRSSPATKLESTRIDQESHINSLRLASITHLYHSNENLTILEQNTKQRLLNWLAATSDRSAGPTPGLKRRVVSSMPVLLPFAKNR